MAISVLLTVGALGAGFVVLSKKRAEMVAPPSGQAAPADTGSPDVVIGDTGIGGSSDGGVTTATAPMGSMEIDQATGADPTEAPATPATTPEGPAKEDPPFDRRDPTGRFSNPPPPKVRMASAAAMKYGSTKQLSAKQEAVALAELGPSTGMVW
jgi:hypothetical protein